MPEQTVILIPAYQEDESLNKLLEEMGKITADLQPAPLFVIVDDGSSAAPVIRAGAAIQYKIISLHRNIGHQKAIAVGLAYIHENIPCQRVLVMDGDGEDRPEDAIALLNESNQKPDRIIFAHRMSRQEGQRFIFFYQLYKIAFRLLTGKRISYGNFLVMPCSILAKAVYYSEIWNHLAGGLLRSGLPYTAVNTHRGKRYAGKSKMDFNGLLLHGLGAIAVFLDVIASRLLVFSLMMIGLSVAGILVLLGIKSFTNLAIPGWTSTVVSAMLIILLQSFLLSLFTIFLYLSSQSQRKFIPAHHYKDYTGDTGKVNAHE